MISVKKVNIDCKYVYVRCDGDFELHFTNGSKMSLVGGFYRFVSCDLKRYNTNNEFLVEYDSDNVLWTLASDTLIDALPVGIGGGGGSSVDYTQLITDFKDDNHIDLQAILSAIPSGGYNTIVYYCHYAFDEIFLPSVLNVVGKKVRYLIYCSTTDSSVSFRGFDNSHEGCYLLSSVYCSDVSKVSLKADSTILPSVFNSLCFGKYNGSIHGSPNSATFFFTNQQLMVVDFECIYYGG